jgi:hypothetical protein
MERAVISGSLFSTGENTMINNLRSLLDELDDIGFSREAKLRFLALFEDWVRDETARAVTIHRPTVNLRVIEGGKHGL